MSGNTGSSTPRTLGGVPLGRVLPALRSLEPGARACWVYDLDAFAARARRMRDAFAPLGAQVAQALKANALPMLLERARKAGLAAEAGSLGELCIAESLGFAAGQRILNGNGRTAEEAAWAAGHGVHSVNADYLGELDRLERAAAAAGSPLRVALRVNPSIEIGGHPYVATGGDEAKFGIAPAEALEAWSARARWPHLRLDGLHLHVGSQILGDESLRRCVEFAFDLRAAAAARGAPLGLVNLGGGFGVDYGGRDEFPLEPYARWLAGRAAGAGIEWVVEPGRWLTAPIGVLLAEVLAVKHRAGRRFVVLAAGMNDLLRPALYGARHRIVPLIERPGERGAAALVGPVCESADVFEREAQLPPVEEGDVFAILDAGAYGAAMSSNYNGRGRLAELVAEGGRLTRARAGEGVEALLARRTTDVLDAG
ncbi:MAG: diaminopimelate decarboxylase [Candidatus Eisenbacteria bacterium]